MLCGSDKRILWYAPGTAPDSLWYNIDLDDASTDVGRRVMPLAINGRYQPKVGDFDGDRCDDILWYAPGTASDAIWYFSPDRTFVSMPLTLNGTSTPVIGNFDSFSATDEILWYSPGAAPESFSVASRPAPFSSDLRRGVFTAAAAPQVTGNYIPLPLSEVDSQGIVWYGLGAAPDALWRSVRAGSTRATSTPIVINGTYSAASVAGLPLFRGSGAAADGLVVGVDQEPDGPASLRVMPGQVDPTTVVATSTRRTGFSVLHQPGVGGDWVFWPGLRASATGVSAGGVATSGASCAVVGSAGLVQCWGAFHGPSASSTAVPRTVNGVSGVTQVATRGDFGCARTRAGTAFCWGNGRLGQLGRFATGRDENAGVISGLPGVTEVQVGDQFGCALASGRVKCWGRNNLGQLGSGIPAGPTSFRYEPQTVAGIAFATDLSVGAEHACAVDAGRVKCWGNGLFGRLGNGVDTTAASPVEVTGISNARRVAAGATHSCALLASGTVCWGDDSRGALGNGAGVGSSNVPTPVTPLLDGMEISAALHKTCVVTADERLTCWGSNFDGGLGTGPVGVGTSAGNNIAPTDFTPVGWTSISVGDFHSCGTNRGSVLCWGRGATRQLGRLVGEAGDISDHPTPGAVNWFR